MDAGGEQANYSSPIPISALDKFLGHSSPLSSPQFAPTVEDHEMEMRKAFGEFSPLGGYLSTTPPPPSPSWLFPLLQDKFDQQQLQQNGIMRSMDGMKRGRGGSPSNFLVKGQWTEDEDNALIELVEDLGIGKWAMIGEKLSGRTGKQCRERWQNHLRCDIKKDSWTEEEERALVKAHQLFGNKWVEIAKQIPGRSDNSIKNHWNAAKRRQNSKRKSKELVDVRSRKPKSCVLQDYIKKLMNFDHSEDLPDNDSSSLLDCDCDDEILFMQNMFKDVNMNHPIAPQQLTYDDQVNSVTVNNPIDHYYVDQAIIDQEVIMEVDPNNKVAESKPLSSDLYMAQQLEGVGYFGLSPFSCLTNEERYNFNCNETNEEEIKWR